jgi:hypothetical protein
VAFFFLVTCCLEAFSCKKTGPILASISRKRVFRDIKELTEFLEAPEADLETMQPGILQNHTTEGSIGTPV